MFSHVKPSPNSHLRCGILRIFNGDSDFSSPTSPSAAYLWRPGRHLTRNLSKLMRNDDSQTHVLDTHGMSRSHHRHVGRFLDVPRCIGKVSQIFQDFVNIMIFMACHVHQIIIPASIHLPWRRVLRTPSLSTRGSVPSLCKPGFQQACIGGDFD